MDAVNARLDRKCSCGRYQWIRCPSLPALHAAIVKQLGEPTNGEWSLEIDATDAQTVNFHYPRALSAAEYEGMAYITPRVRLEFGAGLLARFSYSYTGKHFPNAVRRLGRPFIRSFRVSSIRGRLRSL